MLPPRPLIAGLLMLALFAAPLSAAQATYKVGVATVDITPSYPVRLNGFAHRKSESEGVTHPIFAKAIAVDDGTNGPAVLLAVDSLGVPDYMTTEVAARLKSKAKLDPARITVTSTHTHTAPMLRDCCPTIFGHSLTADELAHIDRYTKELTDHIERAALAALKDVKPATIELGIGSVGFAINRREGSFGPGPVDHDLPVLSIRGDDGKLLALYTSYACHCVTLSHNRISGDWAGYAAAQIERTHPGAIALTSIGCGADQNPSSNPVGDRADVAEAQGKQIADEIDRLLKQGLAPIHGPITTKLNRITLPFDKHPTREQWEATAKQQDYAGYHARVNLAKLDRGEKLQTELSYPIQTWTFGDALAMVFLPGEVVVDYSIRLKREFDRSRLWINGYSNDVPCYIPSERILKEGGYEGGGAMIFYDRPAKLATGIEQKIVDEVHAQLPEQFAAPKGTEGVAPRSPEQSRHAIRVKEGLEVELVASEPLVQSPVAIDWDARGRVWVCEMLDYPTGADQNWQPGGRVKILSDTDDDGRLDKATVFLDQIPFPTGLMAWGDGVLVCAAPDILFARDSDNDGKADVIEKIFSGFATDNYQARVNGLSLGLDNWIYGANGLLGGTITGAGETKLDIRNHDFRFGIDGSRVTGPMEIVTGLTQQGRVRDDFGRWFGCDNSRALLHYPHEQRYLARNPHATPTPAPIFVPPGDFDINRVFPVSRTLERFNDPSNVNRVTSACGLGIYRGTLLGEAFHGNAFTCEPVHNLVHRLILEGDGAAMKRRRADAERESEFLASTDNWFRPVQARPGPDGALYIVDMYRFLIEHPRWIPAERLAQLDVRAGADKGRIYRVRPSGKTLPTVRDLTTFNAKQLAAALDTTNGTERDRVHAQLLVRKDASLAPVLEAIAKEAGLPQVRVQALAVLDGLDSLSPATVEVALKERDPRVRAAALRLSEPLLQKEATVAAAAMEIASDPSPLVRVQLALTLGSWSDRRAGEALAKLAAASPDDAEMRFAVLSSAAPHCSALFDAVERMNDAAKYKWIPPLVATAATSDKPELLSRAVLAVLPAKADAARASHFSALSGLLDVLDRRGVKLDEALAKRVGEAISAARRIAGDANAAEIDRTAALALLGRSGATGEELDLLCDLAGGAASDDLRSAALAALRRQQASDVATRLIARWPKVSPAARPHVLALLLERDAWTTSLLSAVKKRRIQPNEISLTDRQRLLSDHPSAAIRSLAKEVFGAQATASRAQILERYATVRALSGKAASGAELFAKNCAACHQFNGVGRDVGASLATVRDRDVDYLVKNILDPNAVVEPRFVNYVVNLKDGRTLAGIIKSESGGELTLATGGAGAIETIGRGDVKDIRATSVSMMPEGFESALDPQQMADLIEFIRHSAAAKQLAGNAPALIKPQSDGALFLPASRAEIFGQSITFENEFANIGYWSGQGDYVAWTIHLPRAAEFDVHLDYACEDASAGNGFVISIGEQSLRGTVAATGADWSRYRQIKLGTLRLPAGEQRLTVRPSEPVRGALMDLRTIALAAPGTQPRWPATTRNAAPAPAGPSQELARDPASIAKLILNPAYSREAREAAINANPQFAADLIAEMTRDLPATTSDVEYERIPWIWRVAIAAGKRNDAAQVERILDVSLPREGEPLRDWQAVVIGGGIINGLSQRNLWPGERITEVIGDDAALAKRWHRALDLAGPMADDESIKPGTRYDALRMLGVEPWQKRGQHLVRYLTHENAELQMGAVSGLVDVNSPHAAAALSDALPHLAESNRKLAVEGLEQRKKRTSSTN